MSFPPCRVSISSDGDVVSSYVPMNVKALLIGMASGAMDGGDMPKSLRGSLRCPFMPSFLLLTTHHIDRSRYCRGTHLVHCGYDLYV